jgi:hypothetical protein
LCGTKIEYAGGEVHLPFSNKNYSYVLLLLLFDTLDLQDFRTTTRSSTRSKHQAQHMQSRQTRTIKNNTPTKKRLKKEDRRNANARNSRNRTIVEKVHLSRGLDYKTQDYMLDIF